MRESPNTACPSGTDCRATSECTRQQCDEDGCKSTGKSGSISLVADEQVEGDCKRLVCEGGEIRAKDDDSDEPDGDGNSCHRVSCKDGEIRATNMENGTSCNATGTCQNGRCTVCDEGQECTRSSDCTIFKIRCADGMPVCEDTHVPREGRACQSGKVCSGGSCVPCVVGAQCDVGTPCFLGRIKSCESGLECEPDPQSGMACGKDESGATKYCVEGLCTAPCREGPCMTATGECQTSLWDCTRNSTPSCMSLAAEDGTACTNGTCRDGACVQHALVNGDFSKGLEGWTTTGQAASFRIQPDPKNDQRITLSTSPDGTSAGGAARGTVSQTFTVPADALALRFNVAGGHAHVRLKDATGNVIEDVTGIVMDETWIIPVSWDLSKRRGQRVTLAIEDDLDSGDVPYIQTTGFDVLREVEAPLRNSQFAREYEDWETSGEGLYFNLYTDFNYYTGTTLDTGVASYGTRLSVSTYSRNAVEAAYGSATRGTLSQMFLVPMDAVAIRFNVCGGRYANISLYRGSEQLETVAAANSDTRKVPVSWDLQPYRGMMLKLSVEDNSTMFSFGYIGVTGFDVITSYNGP